MLSIRRATWRFLSSPPVLSIPRSRAITTITSPSYLRIQKQTLPIAFQRRWASEEANKEGAPISQLQPTPQEEVENVIHEDNAARTVESATESPSDSTQQVSHTADAQAQQSFESTSQTPEVTSPPPLFQSRSQRTRAAPSRSADAAREPKSTVYIGNLFFDVTEDDLTKEVARFGQIEKVKLIRDARGLSKGFGYVTFSNVDDATKAIDSLNQQLYEGRRLNVGYANTDLPPLSNRRSSEGYRRTPMNPPSRTLFIGNMSWEMTDRDLNNLFRGIQNLIDVRVAIDRRTGQPRGFAHADFTDVKSAQEAMKQLETQEPLGRKLRLDYSFGPSNAPRNQARDAGEL